LGIEETVELVNASLPGKGKEDYFVSKFGRLLLFHEEELKIITLNIQHNEFHGKSK